MVEDDLWISFAMSIALVLIRSERLRKNVYLS
jgi:hypothetical protein